MCKCQMSGLPQRTWYDYEYEPVDDADVEEYFMDDNKFEQLPWEDLMYVDYGLWNYIDFILLYCEAP